MEIAAVSDGDHAWFDEARTAGVGWFRA